MSFDSELHGLDLAGLRRRARPVDGRQGPELLVDGRQAVNFAANDYLGLASHPALVDAATRAMQALGFGAGASRLISGSWPPHRQLEQALAAFFDHEAAVLFNSGTHANQGVLQSLAGPGDEIFSDQLNHASIIDGCTLSRARVTVYPHRDLVTLDRQLRSSQAARRVIVSESLFSMDGDLADLRQLRLLASEHRALLVLDEAHAVGVLGPGGRGQGAAAGIQPDVLVGTLGKAFGSFGAFAAGSATTVEWLRNRARAYIFSTALPPAIAAAGLAALGVVQSQEGDRLRAALDARIADLARLLAARGQLATGAGHSPIFPFIVGDTARTMALSDALLERGHFVQGIRPPTVPPGTSRLRITLSALHTPTQVAQLVAQLPA
jgi:8-amino-7-oxononanoate synthase